MNLSRRQLIIGSLALPAFAAKKAGETPHIVLILSENVPAWMLGCYGNKEVRTPHIDRLAQTGTRFLTHITGSVAPAEARNALLSGSNSGSGATLEKLLGAAGYATKAVSDSAAALSSIDGQQAGKPFFVTVTLSGFAPPYANAAKFLDSYATAKLDTFEQVPAAANITLHQEFFGGKLAGNLRTAAASVTAIDAEVGAIAARLTEKKLADNTLVIFTAPTGSLVGRHGLWDGANASNPPNFYEEVIATPMIWTWPARILPAATRPELISAFDLLPTICDLTPADDAAGNLPGRSYLPVLEGKPLPKKQPWEARAFLWTKGSGVAHDNRYKLVLRNEGKGPNELYDLKADARERVNQFDNPQFLTVKTQLTGELTSWKQKYSV